MLIMLLMLRGTTTKTSKTAKARMNMMTTTRPKTKISTKASDVMSTTSMV